MRQSNRSTEIFSLLAAAAVTTAVVAKAAHRTTSASPELADERSAARQTISRKHGMGGVRASLVAVAVALFAFGSISGASSAEAPGLTL